MTSLIKHLFVIILISSCSAVSNETIRFLKGNLNFSNQSEEELDPPKFSYISMDYDNQEYTFILSAIDSFGVETWIGPDFRKINTYKGLIVFSNGLGNDLTIANQDKLKIINSFPSEDVNFPITLSAPLLINTSTILKKDKVVTNKGCENLVIYKRRIVSIKKNFRDEFCYDRQGAIIYSKQTLDPLSKKLILHFNYIY